MGAATDGSDSNSAATTTPSSADVSASVAPAMAASWAPKWWLAALPAGPVVREEIRRLSVEKQERVAAAFLRMMTDLDDGVPGTSQYFRLAVIHGGMPRDLPADAYPEYCAHRRECFPGWHRAYLVAFEQMFRRADLANQAAHGQAGGDFGLPYWDWTAYSVVGPNSLDGSGECFPRIVREKLLVDFGAIPGFFPAAVGGKPSRDYTLTAPPEQELRWKLSGHADDAWFFDRRDPFADDFAGLVDAALHQPLHKLHASGHYFNGSPNSIENSHNAIHVAIGGVMARMSSAFHPIFWLHHNNVDRVYESYLTHFFPHDISSSLSRAEQAREQFEHFQDGDPETAPFLGESRLTWRDDQVAEGFPEGPYGVFMPFEHPSRPDDRKIGAKDTFDTVPLGYTFDALITPTASQASAATTDALPQASRATDAPPALSHAATVGGVGGPVGRLQRERPSYASFERVDIRELEEPLELYVFLQDAREDAGWTPPPLPPPSVAELLRRPDYGGTGGAS